MLLKTRALSSALGVERSRFHQVVAVCIGFPHLVSVLLRGLPRTPNVAIAANRVSNREFPSLAVSTRVLRAMANVQPH